MHLFNKTSDSIVLITEPAAVVLIFQTISPL
jgi:hypothetical protein